jgi:hypothetical protein
VGETCTVCAAKQRGKSGLAPYSGRYETPACATKLARPTRAAVNPSPFQSRLRITGTPLICKHMRATEGRRMGGAPGACGKPGPATVETQFRFTRQLVLYISPRGELFHAVVDHMQRYPCMPGGFTQLASPPFPSPYPPGAGRTRGTCFDRESGGSTLDNLSKLTHFFILSRCSPSHILLRFSYIQAAFGNIRQLQGWRRWLYRLPPGRLG